MNIYINNLSYSPGNVTADLIDVLDDFVNCCERVSHYSFEKIFMPDNYPPLEIISDGSFVNFQSGKYKGNLLQSRLNSIIANQLIKIREDEESQDIQYVRYAGEESEFFRRSFNQNVPVISFRTHHDFDDDFLDVTNHFLDEKEEEITSDEKIVNISNSTHFVSHLKFLTTKKIQHAEFDARWNPIEDPVRFKDASCGFLRDVNFDLKNKNLDNNRVNRANSIGRKIAELNGWKYNSDLSGKNGRSVFKAPNQKAYLSIDTKTVSFEAHDRKGIHKGEFNFEGKEIDPADTQNRHNLKFT